MKSGSMLGSVQLLAWKSNTKKSTWGGGLHVGKWNHAQLLEDMACGIADRDQPLMTAGERS